jgi:hypothetical protein
MISRRAWILEFRSWHNFASLPLPAGWLWGSSNVPSNGQLRRFAQKINRQTRGANHSHPSASQNKNAKIYNCIYLFDGPALNKPKINSYSLKYVFRKLQLSARWPGVPTHYILLLNKWRKMWVQHPTCRNRPIPFPSLFNIFRYPPMRHYTTNSVQTASIHDVIQASKTVWYDCDTIQKLLVIKWTIYTNKKLSTNPQSILVSFAWYSYTEVIHL